MHSMSSIELNSFSTQNKMGNLWKWAKTCGNGPKLLFKQEPTYNTLHYVLVGLLFATKIPCEKSQWASTHQVHHVDKSVCNTFTWFLDELCYEANKKIRMSISIVPSSPLSCPNPRNTVPRQPLGDSCQVTVPQPPLRTVLPPYTRIFRHRNCTSK